MFPFLYFTFLTLFISHVASRKILLNVTFLLKCLFTHFPCLLKPHDVSSQSHASVSFSSHLCCLGFFSSSLYLVESFLFFNVPPRCYFLHILTLILLQKYYFSLWYLIILLLSYFPMLLFSIYLWNPPFTILYFAYCLGYWPYSLSQWVPCLLDEDSVCSFVADTKKWYRLEFGFPGFFHSKSFGVIFYKVYTIYIHLTDVENKNLSVFYSCFILF